jgi:hypothetical protein
MEAWKRRQNELAHIWEMTEIENDQSIRAEFKADVVISSKTKSIRSVNTAHTRTRRLLTEVPITLLSVGTVIACFIGNAVYVKAHTSDYDSIGASVISAVIIIVLGEFYEYLAVSMANWENHRFQDQYQDSLISKFFVFQFVNSNIALFFIAFYVQNFNQLALNLGIILVVKQLSISVLQNVLPKVKVSIKKMLLHKKYKAPENADKLAAKLED